MRISKNRKWWVLGSLSFALVAVGLDLTVLNVALPTLARELHASTSDLQWFADAYNLVLAAALLPAGMLGDRFGRKKMILMALILFGAASLGCASADSSEMLIGMRAVLGLGAAFLIPLSMSVLPVLFSEEERTRAMMIWATANMISIPLGPIVGGWLLEHYHWSSIFLLNIPFVVIAVFAVLLLMPESRSAYSPRLDWLGVVTSSLGLVGVTYGVIRAGEKGWSNTEALLLLIAGVIVLAGFVLWQRKTKHPLIDLSLFRTAGFTWGSALATLVSFALFGLLFALPLYFQEIGGADALGTGMRLLPLIGGLIIGAQASDKLSPRIGKKAIVAAGFIFLAAGLGLGGMTDVQSGYGFAAFWITVTGMGTGLALPMAMDAALGELSAERSGIGSALIMALRQVGGSIGVAILGTTLNSIYRHQIAGADFPDAVVNEAKQSVSAGVAIADRLQSPELLHTVHRAFVHGMHVMLWECAAVAVLGFILALLFLPNKKALENGKRKVG